MAKTITITEGKKVDANNVRVDDMSYTVFDPASLHGAGYKALDGQHKVCTLTDEGVDKEYTAVELYDLASQLLCNAQNAGTKYKTFLVSMLGYNLDVFKPIIEAQAFAAYQLDDGGLLARIRSALYAASVVLELGERKFTVEKVERKVGKGKEVTGYRLVRSKPRQTVATSKITGGDKTTAARIKKATEKNPAERLRLAAEMLELMGVCENDLAKLKAEMAKLERPEVKAA